MQFSWQKEWENLQKLNETEYNLYFEKSKKNNLEFEFLQIDFDGFASFKYGFRLMKIHKHPFQNWLQNHPKEGFKISFSQEKEKYIDSKPNINFAISLCSDGFFGHAVPILTDRITFVKYCCEFGISKSHIQEFLNMKEVNWTEI